MWPTSILNNHSVVLFSSHNSVLETKKRKEARHHHHHSQCEWLMWLHNLRKKNNENVKAYTATGMGWDGSELNVSNQTRLHAHVETLAMFIQAIHTHPPTWPGGQTLPSEQTKLHDRQTSLDWETSCICSLQTRVATQVFSFWLRAQLESAETWTNS